MSAAELELPTRCAHWGWYDHRYFGHAVFEELAGKSRVTGLFALSVLGRQLTDDCLETLDDIACVCTLADPRIWPLKMTRIVAAYGSTLPAVAAGCLILQSARIGPWKTADAAVALAELHAKIGLRADDAAVVACAVAEFASRNHVISGFGAPFHDHDERLLALRTCIERRGRDQLPHWRTMEAVAKQVRSSRHLHPNLGLGLAAALLDMGITVAEIGPICTIFCQHMFFANAVEGAQQSPEVLKEIPSNCISYIGKAPRVSPKAQARHPNSMIRAVGHRAPEEPLDRRSVYR